MGWGAPAAAEMAAKASMAAVRDWGEEGLVAVEKEREAEGCAAEAAAVGTAKVVMGWVGAGCRQVQAMVTKPSQSVDV